MTKRKPEEVARSGVEELDRLIQENEELRAENEILERQLNVARDFLLPQWDECKKLIAIFGDAPTMESPAQNGDPLLRFRPLLDNAGRESYRKVAQIIVDMGGRATIKQIAAAAKYSTVTVGNAILWLKAHEVVHKDGKEAVIEK